MVAVPVHQVVSVPPVLLPKLLQDLLHLLLREVGVPQVDGLFVPKLLPQLGGFPGTNVKNARERKRVSTISIFSPIHLQPRVVDPQPHVGRVVVGPEHVVDVQDDWLTGHIKYSCFFNFLSLVGGTERYLARSVHHFGQIFVWGKLRIWGGSKLVY